MKGFYHQILKLNLTCHGQQIEPISDDILERFLGGKGLATHLLMENNPTGVDPMSPENHLVLATGPVAGTPVWGS